MPVLGSSRCTGEVLVIGAGVAGVRASLDLARVGCHVTLIDSAPIAGGIVQRLDHQFPTNHCGMCRMLPDVGRPVSTRSCLRTGLIHDDIDFLPLTCVTDVQGEAGDFHVTLSRKPRFVDSSLCGGCPAPCVEACPVETPDRHNCGLTMRKAIDRALPRMLVAPLTIERDVCTDCGQCVQACPSGAIELDACEESRTARFDAIVVAVGADASPSAAARRLQVSRDVVTATELERMLSLAGPRATVLRRPSDGRAVRRAAWIQCVGSRDRKGGADRCSSVCCMFALKEAMLVRGIGGGVIETTIFYMDIRGRGPELEGFRASALDAGVVLRRSRVHDVVPVAGGRLRIRHAAAREETVRSDEFDLVVLSTGQRPNRQLPSFGPWLGWSLAEDEFAPESPHGIGAPRPGVYTCGSVSGPRDIAESVVEATAVAGAAHALLLSLGRRLGSEVSPSLPTSKDGAVAAMVCRCHLDKSRAATCESAGIAVIDSPCARERRVNVMEWMRGCERVVVGACTEHAHRRTFHRLAREVGITPENVRVVDAGESLLPVHMAIAELGTEDRSELVEMRAYPRVLVVGGGLSGNRAALTLAEVGVEVELVERAEDIGGRFKGGGSEAGGVADALAARVKAHERISVHCRAKVVSSRRWPGRRVTTIRKDDRDIEVTHGATILATGARAAGTDAYGHGRCDRVLTQWELEQRLDDGEFDATRLGVVVMIQCVGSRHPKEHAYCSQVCCTKTLEQVRRIQRESADVRAFVLYRDMMVRGGGEQQLSETRASGVVFVPYDRDDAPIVEIVDGRPCITVFDPALGRRLVLTADLLVLSTAIEPDDSNGLLGSMFGVSCDEHGFFEPADPKWRPVDAWTEGVFVAGTARGPGRSRDALVQGDAAAARALARLTVPLVTDARMYASVNHARCVLCGRCIDACSYGARMMSEEDRVEVDPMACRVCGMCTAACRNGAAKLGAMGQRQMMAVLDAALLGIGRMR